MQFNEISKNTYKWIIEPSKELPKLYGYFEELIEDCNSELEFISRHRKVVNDLFSCRELENYQLVQEDIGLLKSEQKKFKIIIELIESNHELLNPKKQFGKLTTKKRGIQYSFKYSYIEEYIIAYHGICKDFNITNLGEEDSMGFSFVLRIMENGKDLKVVDLYPDSESKYKGKGISIGMILHVKDKFKKRVISSSNKNLQNLYREFNTDEAIEKVWKRMESRELVEYNEEEDYYYTKK